MSKSGKGPGVFAPNRRPLFYYITDRKQLGSLSLTESIRRNLASGIDIIQIREKDLDDRRLYELTSRVVGMARKFDCKIILNGRADIALAAGAHGVHLPSAGLKPTDLRTWIPKEFLVGVSVHSLREANAAVQQGADYLLLGPIYKTESKLPYGAPLGIECLKKACVRIPIPVFGLGGINPGKVVAVLRSGAAGVAGISLFQSYLRQWMALRKSLQARSDLGA